MQTIKKFIVVTVVIGFLAPVLSFCAMDLPDQEAKIASEQSFVEQNKQSAAPLEQRVEPLQFGALKQEKTYECEGVRYTKNNFGDIFPLWQEISVNQLAEKLTSFVMTLKEEVHEKPFIIEVPHEKFAVLSAIQEANFTLHSATAKKTEWIFRNQSSIPLPYNSIAGAQVVVRKNDEVLVVEEKTRKKLLGFPAGTSELEELMRVTAARELNEEVGLVVDPNDLELVAMRNRVRANRFGANEICHYYTIAHDKTSGDYKANPQEIVRAFFAPLQAIAESADIQGLSVAPIQAALARHLLEGRTRSRAEKLLDFRQLFKKEADRDQSDVMTVEFFAK